MSKAVSPWDDRTLQKLRERGDRAMVNSAQVIDAFYVVVADSRRLRDRIHFLHHREPLSFERTLFFAAQSLAFSASRAA